MHLDLLVTADYPSRVAELRLLDAGGNQLAYRYTDFKAITVSRQRGVFDLRDHLRHYAGGRDSEIVAELGVCIAEEVLGAEIFGHLWASQAERTLRIQLPGAGDRDNHLAAALARVPWEIARPTPQQKTLAERNLLIRVVHDLHTPASEPLALADNEPLRVLLVFAEARGSRPLDARRERRALLQLFEKEIYPQRRVVAHVLSHGVTRERLAEQIATNGGYHIVHWSGHGHLNLLELAKTGGAKDFLSGEELVELFAQAGGLLPRLFFLGACHSGDILRVTDWNDFFAVARDGEPGTRAADTRDLDLTPRPGYTGTAHALLRSGVPSVVAMRYAVRDDYARDLAVEFYRRLLADAKPKTVAAALTGARKALLDARNYTHARFSAGDHATPVLYGEAELGLTLASVRSPALDARDPRLHKVGELTLTAHEHFVGRMWELAGLGVDFIGARADAHAKPVAVITGLGGMGKTALVAEALSLWATRFAWVMLYQAKPNPLAFEATLRDIDQKLRAELGRYHAHIQNRPADAIHRDATPDFKGPARLERLTNNLIRALKDEPILLVLDNFETNLKPQPEPTTNTSLAWACQDPVWDACLARLAEELVGAPSRVLLTCRRPLVALPNTASHEVTLGPLPPGEAALFLKEHSGLSKMVFGVDAEEKKLAQRLLTASRFHPLLMDRLARLATDPALRSQFRDALQALETAKDFCNLPALFAADVADPRERGYLKDALATSLNVLIQDANPDTRCLLWMIAMANDPVTLGLLRAVWSGESHAQQQLRQLKMALDLPQLARELQAQLPAVSAELRAEMDALRPAPARPDLVPLLGQLVAVGLVTEQRTGPDDKNPDYTCHELVRERVRVWIEQNPRDRGPWTENALRLAYADWLEAAFQSLQQQNTVLALEAGSRALIYCVQAGAYDRLGTFASEVVTGSGEPRLLARLLPHLQTAAESAPEGQPRWRCLRNLADALHQVGRPDASLEYYAQAADQARAKAAGGDMRAWADVAVICANWSVALRNVGEFDTARKRLLEAAEAHRITKAPAIYILASELETLRIDILQDPDADVLPKIDSRLSRVEAWWQRHRDGALVPEAPDGEVLARVLFNALDCARQAHVAKRDWEGALQRVDAIRAIKRVLGRPAEDMAREQMNRANVLARLGRFSEAQLDLETCLELFQDNPAGRARVFGSFADLFDERGDVSQAIAQQRRALALCETLPDPRDRATSHNNLSNYLQRNGMAEALAEAHRHRLAALLYRLAAGLGEQLRTSLRTYFLDYVRTYAVGTMPNVPRVCELLADPAFHPLAQWLRQREVDLVALQATVDQVLDATRQAVLAGK